METKTMNRLKFSKLLIAGAAFVGLSMPASADILRIAETDFNAGAGLITFSEFGLGTVNPTYTPGDYGGEAGDPTVTFGGFFDGQSLSGTPAVDCPGSAASGCVVGTPTGPLSLAAGSPDTFITSDGANPTSPVLSGTPTFNGPVGILFDVDVAGVGLDGGFFNAAGGTAITAFARDGSLLGSVLNEGTGIEFLGLVSDDGSEEIAGLLFSLVGPEPFGFAIDNVRFGFTEDVRVPAIPEPATWLMMVLGFALVARVYRRRVRAELLSA